MLASVVMGKQSDVSASKRIVKGDGLFACDARTVRDRLRRQDFLPMCAARAPSMVDGSRAPPTLAWPRAEPRGL